MHTFGDTVVDIEAREVRRGEHEAHLEPQAFDVLAYLLTHRDRVVSKEELLNQVWGDQFVSESALSTRIKEIRAAFGDDGRRQDIIKTVHGRGYRFIARATRDDSLRTAPSRTVRGSHLNRALPVIPQVVGRHSDMSSLQQALDASVVVSIVGPGGVGKTTLAIQMAPYRQDRHHDGVHLVDLAAIARGDRSAVVAAVREVAARTSPALSDVEALAAVADLDALLILDNCEHVADAAAGVVGQLLARGSPLRILATSREPLGLAVEQIYRLQPLSDVAALDLLAQRARLGSWTDTTPVLDMDAAGRVLLHLDGLPLAIEMAAGNLPSMSLAELATLLGERLHTLHSSSRQHHERHRTLADVLSWSLELLDEDQRTTFAGLSAFAAGVGLDDVVAVLSTTGADRMTLLNHLSTLVDRSLVVADHTDRATSYRLLETTREQLRNSHPHRFDQRHARWFAEVARGADADLRSPREDAGHGRLVQVLPELRAAHAWARANEPSLAVELSWAMSLFGQSRLRGEPGGWAARMLRQTEACDPAVAAALAVDAALRSDYTHGIALARRGLESPEVCVQLTALDAWVDISLYQGDFETTRRLSEQLFHLGTEHGDLHSVTMGLVGHVLADLYGGNPQRAQQRLADVELGPMLAPSDQAWLAYLRAEVLSAEAPLVAIGEYERAIAVAEPVGSRFVASVARVSLAAALARHDDPHRAVDQFRTILIDISRDGNLTHAVTSLRNLTELLVRLGADQPAMTLLGAVSSHEVKASFGSEEQAAQRSRAQVIARAGQRKSAAWEADGRDQGLTWAMNYARRELDALDNSA